MKTRFAFRAGGLVLCTSIGLCLVDPAAHAAFPEGSAKPRPFPAAAAGEQSKGVTREAESARPATQPQQSNTTRRPAKRRPVKQSFTSKLRRLFGGSPRQSKPQEQKIIRTAAEESAIQKQLRLLYEKDGKQMPSMNLKDVPTAQPKANPGARQQPGASAAPAAPRKKPGLLNRIFPFKRSAPPRRTASQKYQPTPFPLSRRPNRTNDNRRVSNTTATPGRIQVSPISQPRQVPQVPGRVPTQPEASASPFGRGAVPTKTPAKPESDVPYLTDAPKSVQKPGKPKTDVLENPFPDGSEEEADAKRAKANPFSGMKLDDEKPAAPKTATVAKPAAEKKPAVAKKAPELKIQPATPRNSVPPKAEPRIVEKPAATPEPQRKPAVEIKPDSQEEKLRRIASRVGLTGLKGFCPIVLRDERDLIDSNPDIRSVYKGKAYYFSSRVAKATFDRNPEKYAPVLSGRDVIKLALLSESVEGSLDHAVWFKDRLYLFSCAESLQSFVREPKRFAVSSEE